MKSILNSLMIALAVQLITTGSFAQDSAYVSPVAPVETGKAPGMKVKLVSENGMMKTYVLIFSPGDELRSGLTEFAQKYNVKNAHFTGIGDAVSVKVGWYDYQRKMFKVIAIDSAEVTSLTGNVAIFENKPVAHAHINVSIEDGSVKGGHLLELYVGPTIEVHVTVENIAIYKKLDKRYNAGVVDLTLDQ